jgi:hypothetical protein
MSVEAKPVPVPTCAHCGMPLNLTLTIKQLGPVQIAIFFCGDCQKTVNIAVLGMAQPQIQPALMIPPRKQ